MNQQDPIEQNRRAFEATEDINVFVIMPFGEKDSQLKKIENVIKETLKEFNFRAVISRDILLDLELWANVKFCMDHCRYAIAVFDQAKHPIFNPNVTLELGYMLAIKRPCLILKDKAIETMPSDIIGRLYWRFSSEDLENSIKNSVQTWLEQLGHSRILPPETITADNHNDANKKRTRRILQKLDHLRTKSPGLIRQAATLSSLAISDDEKRKDPKFHDLIKQEREAILDLLKDDWTVRILICPAVQIDWVGLQVKNEVYAQRTILPRYKQLLDIIKNHIDNPQLQIAYTSHLSRQNLLVLDEDVVFIGRRLQRDKGFPHTTVIFDPAVIQNESREFDIAFTDSVGILLNKRQPDEVDFGSRTLKNKVTEHIQKCRSRLLYMMQFYTSFNIKIFDQDIDVLIIEKLQNSIDNYANVFGYEEPELISEHYSSFFKEIQYHLTKTISYQDILSVVEDATIIYRYIIDGIKDGLEKQGVENTKKKSAAIADILKNLENIDNAVLHLGKILIIKQRLVSGRSEVRVIPISLELQSKLEYKPEILDSPETVIHALRGIGELTEAINTEKYL